MVRERYETRSAVWMPPDGIFSAVIEDVEFGEATIGATTLPVWNVAASVTDDTTGDVWEATTVIPLVAEKLIRVYRLIKATGAALDLTNINLREDGAQLVGLPLRVRVVGRLLPRGPDGERRGWTSQIVRFLADGEND